MLRDQLPSSPAPAPHHDARRRPPLRAGYGWLLLAVGALLLAPAGCANEVVVMQGQPGGNSSGCGPGMQDHDGDGTCRPDCANSDLSCVHGTCSDQTGIARCVCDPGYAGGACSACATGYQDNDHDGSCSPTCGMLGYTCSNHGSCSDANGTAHCECDPGYSDDGQGHCVTGGGDSCDNPIPLDLGAGVVTGSTIGAGNDYSGACVMESGPEVVYEFEVQATTQVSFHVSGYDTLMYLRSECENMNAELACDDDSGGELSSAFSVSLSPGTYYLFIDGWGGEQGNYELQIQLNCPPGTLWDPNSNSCVDNPCEPNPCNGAHQHQCAPVLPGSWDCSCDPGYVPDPNNPNQCILDSATGESCADPLTLPSTGQGTVNGNTGAAQNDEHGSCAGQGPDHVYTFTLAEESHAEFHMTGYDTVLYIRTDCDSMGSEVACNDDDQGVNAALTVTLDAGTYYLFADSFSGGGSYQLSYDFADDPCSPDPCPGLQQCEPNDDWSDYECVCPAGTVPYNNTCVDDPCDPNLCLGGNDHRDRCDPLLATNTYQCICDPGYIEDPNDPGGVCMPDPNGQDWTVLVYLNADNNLEPDGFDDLAEMEVAGSNAAVNIVVLMDTYQANGGAARKLYVEQGSSTLLENMGEVDMGHWQTLADFGVWGVQNYPAHHYALIMWDHGDGWKSPDAQRPLTRAFSNDDHGSSEGISISAGDYANALAAITAAAGGPLDLVGFDACLMGMWEVFEATAPYADVLVASEETEPLHGWSWDDFLVPFVQNPQWTAAELGTEIVDTYHAESGSNATLSVTDLSTVAPLRAAVSAFADALLAHPNLYGSVDNARQSAQSFTIWEHRDLWDFADNVRNMANAPADLVAAADALIVQLGISILHNQNQGGYGGAYGLAIYLPGQGWGIDQDYLAPGAVWSQQSTWDEFLLDFAQ